MVLGHFPQQAGFCAAPDEGLFIKREGGSPPVSDAQMPPCDNATAMSELHSYGIPDK
jgi:hypothetical protein